MNKEIAVERTWQVVQFEPLRCLDSITEIPEVIASNPEAMKLLRYLQLVDIEWTHISYMNLRKNMPKIAKPEDIEAALTFVEQERTRTFEQLLNTIKHEE